MHELADEQQGRENQNGQKWVGLHIVQFLAILLNECDMGKLAAENQVKQLCGNLRLSRIQKPRAYVSEKAIL